MPNIRRPERANRLFQIRLFAAQRAFVFAQLHKVGIRLEVKKASIRFEPATVQLENILGLVFSKRPGCHVPTPQIRQLYGGEDINNGHQTLRDIQHYDRGFFIPDRHRAYCVDFVLIDGNDDPFGYVYWGTSVPVVGEFRENVLYGYGSDDRYYVLGNNVATLCDRNKGGYVYMTSEYSKWINLKGGDCNVTAGSREITPARCDDPESAVFVFVTEDSAGRIVDWTRPYFPCTHVREIVVNGAMKAIDGFIVVFTRRWRYQQGMWMNVVYTGRYDNNGDDCSFRVCVNARGETLPEYIVKGLYCQRGGKTVTVGMCNFPYYGMVNGLGLKCLVVV